MAAGAVCPGMTRYVLADLQEVRAELTRRATELTTWLDRQAGQFRPADEPAVALGDLACVQAVSAAAVRLAAAADTVAACAEAMDATDAGLCRWSE